MKKNISVKVSILITVTFLVVFSYVTGQAQTISTIAGTAVNFSGPNGFSGDNGPATLAEMNFPSAVAVDAAGNVYIVDAGNFRVRKVDGAGIITTVAGNGTQVFNGDGIAATTAGIAPASVAVDAAGNIYIADGENQRIRKVNTMGTISTVAGNGTAGYNGDGIAATTAELNGPAAVAIDTAGNLYIADQDNNRIRMVNITGTISTIAGNGTYGYTGNGGLAINAEMANPQAVAVDASGSNIYISDAGNNVVRKIDVAGVITTVAGNGNIASSFSGDGGPAIAADLYNLQGVAVDATGMLYLADANNQRIRLVNAAGIISTVAGMATIYNLGGYSGDGGSATAAALQYPFGIAFDNSDNMYIADRNNHRIRKVTPPPCTSVTAGTISTSGSTTFCGTGSDTLILNGASTGNNIIHHWEYSVDGINWTIANDDSLIYPTSSIAQTTYFRNFTACSYGNISDTTLIDSIVITPIVMPSIIIAANPSDSVGQGQHVTFKALISGGGTNPIYQWFKNGVPIPGANGDAYTDNSPANNDTITCTIRSNAPCADTNAISSDPVIMHITLGVGTIANNTLQLGIYPNPNNGTFNITGSVYNSKEAQLEVLNVIGQVIHQSVIPVQNNQLNTQIILPNENANGIYTLRIKTDNSTNTRRFVIQK